MTIESLTLESAHILLDLRDELREIAADESIAEAHRAFSALRADTLDAWVDAVGASARRRASARRPSGPARPEQPAGEPTAASPLPTAGDHREWIPVTGALADTGQFAFRFANGPLAGLPLSVSFYGPGAVLWLARNASGEMFMRPWSPGGEGDVPNGALVIGSYRPALLAGTTEGFEWLPVANG